MNILFLTIGLFDSINQHGVHPDLLRSFKNEGHRVFAVSSRENRQGLPTELIDEDGAQTLKVRVGNITKTGVIEKGISTILIEKKYIAAIKKFFSGVKFDLVLYTTPPITLVGVVDYIKKRDNAKTYLMLKDIFPQNAVDIGMMCTHGLKGVLYRYFRIEEKRLYDISDMIGCMSQANVNYILKHNPQVKPEKVEICPNCIEALDISMSDVERIAIREKYGIPTDKKVFVYGGNLGKPQDISFIIKCFKAVKDKEAFFFIVGGGTEYGKLETFINEEKSKNVMLMKSLAKTDYDKILAACDVGLIFLDHRFTIPNFPSRLLDYMQASLPVLACTDPNTDVGKVIVEGDFGWWCESNSAREFDNKINNAMVSDLIGMEENSMSYLKEHYSVQWASEPIKKFAFMR